MRLQNPQWGGKATRHPRVLGGEGDMGPYQPMPILREFFYPPVHQQHPPELRQPAIYSDGKTHETSPHSLGSQELCSTIFVMQMCCDIHLHSAEPWRYRCRVRAAGHGSSHPCDPWEPQHASARGWNRARPAACSSTPEPHQAAAGRGPRGPGPGDP